MTASFRPPYLFENKLLGALPQEALQALRPMLTKLRMVTGQVLVEQGEVPESVYFIEDGLVALVADTGAPRSSVQVAMIGRDGMIGGLALLGAEKTSYARAVCLVPGGALRVSGAKLQFLAQQHEALREVCTNHVAELVRQTMHNAACSAGGTLVERCARWLLMAHSRLDGDDVRITHETLATMLGVRRAGVTVVAANLQAAGLIKLNRGRITILDRPGLAAISRDPTVMSEAGPADVRPRQDASAADRLAGASAAEAGSHRERPGSLPA